MDSTAPNLNEHRSTVLQVLQQLGVSDEKLQNMIEVWNKVLFVSDFSSSFMSTPSKKYIAKKVRVFIKLCCLLNFENCSD